MSEIEVAGARIEYARIGAADMAKPTLVFLHEGLGSLSLWRDFPAAVAAATGCPAFVYSRQGYGKSDPVALPRPLDFMQREAMGPLPALLQAAKIDDAILIGHSDGASIALVYAGLREKASATRADGGPRLRGLAVLAPHVFVERFCVDAIARTDEAYRTTDLRARLERHHGTNVDCAFRGWADCWLDPKFLAWNIESYLGSIAVPTLVIQGEDDEYGTLEQVARIRRGVRSPVETLVLRQCGHSPQRDRPDATLDALALFVGGLL
ncbi:MAG TPA: alpha/beta hydrolase [Alphaproteobacteria bacterium]|nr:alpha/beta hydrolase [Alphaproteobacteria bacterium]